MATHLLSWQSIAGEMEDVLARTWLESFQISTDRDGQKSILEKDWTWRRSAKEEARCSVFQSFSGLAVERDLRKRRSCERGGDVQRLPCVQRALAVEKESFTRGGDEQRLPCVQRALAVGGERAAESECIVRVVWDERAKMKMRRAF
ncbi:hypothetical protein MRB53_016508 [Persea americana]|uniref:Uncharacterized protein n=1 Tax=Persea americana TaxID=3435 RepID=A0ACC2M2J1_PERAE|nr:hypothetical protein MRB53_016508 [Persea americana]